MAQFTFRRFEHSELDAYFNLFSRLIQEVFTIYPQSIREYMLVGKRGWNREAWEKYHEQKYRHIYGAWAGDQLVGILHGYDDFCGIAQITWLMVDPPYQKKGAGKYLVSQFEHTVKERGMHAVHLWCIDKNVVYYEKLGYTHASRYEKWWFGIDSNMMIKRLGEPDESSWLGDE